MSIRKTGAVTGNVTGVEDAGDISKTAAASEPAWTADDERQLTGENADADKGDADS